MLNKLLRYEIKVTARALLPIGGGVLVFTLVTGLANLILNSQQDLPSLVEFAQALLDFAAILALVFVVGACVFVNVQRFYKLLGEQGYFMLSLPVPVWQHILAKLLCACLWTIACAVYLGLCGGILSGSVGGLLVLGGVPNLSEVAIGLMLFLVFLVLLAGTYLQFYLACAIGGQFGQQRLLASIISYFVLGFLEQILAVFLLIMTTFSAVQVDAGSWLESLVRVNPNWIAAGIFIAAMLFMILEEAVKWAIIQWLMTRRLNLV